VGGQRWGASKVVGDNGMSDGGKDLGAIQWGGTVKGGRGFTIREMVCDFTEKRVGWGVGKYECGGEKTKNIKGKTH